METLGYNKYTEKIEQYERDIQSLVTEEAQLTNEINKLEKAKTTTIEERKSKSRNLIEKRSELQVTTETLKALKEEFNQYCLDSLDEVDELIYNLGENLLLEDKKRKERLNNQIKEFANEFYKQIVREEQEQNALENQVSEISDKLSKITSLGKVVSKRSYGVNYKEDYSNNKELNNVLKSLALN